MKFAQTAARAALVSACMVGAGMGAAQAKDLDLFSVALCEPAYTMDVGAQVYEQLEKVSKYVLKGGVGTFRLPQPIQREGFVAKEGLVGIGFAGLTIDGERASELAQRYQLKADKVFGATKSFSRPLSADKQPPVGLAGTGLASIVARESAAMPGQTLLGCEFVSDVDRKAMQEFMRK